MGLLDYYSRFLNVPIWTKEYPEKFIEVLNDTPLPCKIHLNRFDSPILKSENVEGETGSSHSTHTLSRSNTKSTKAFVNKRYAHGVVRLILLDLFAEIFRPFRVHLLRGELLPPFMKLRISIKFVPCFAEGDYVEEVLKISFENEFKKDHHEVTLIGTLAPQPIAINKKIILMETAMIGVGIWQLTFEVKNLSKKFYSVCLKLPSELSKHFTLIPDAFILRPETMEEILLRANVGVNLKEDAGEMLNCEQSLLKFNIEVKSKGLPKILVPVVVILSDPTALKMKPNFINFGFVFTCETAVANISLKNNTSIPLHFAFLHVPKWCMIMPEYGISQIEAYQNVTLQILYSPTTREAGKPGGQAAHTFSIVCTTLECLARKATIKVPELEEKICKHYGKLIKPKKEMDLKLHEVLSIPKNDYIIKTKTITKSSPNPNLATLDIFWSMPVKNIERVANLASYKVKVKKLADYTVGFAEPMEDEVHPLSSDFDHPFLILKCMATVIDPICELTANKIILPDTPLGSFSYVSIYLRCPNQAGGTTCECGRYIGLQDDPEADITAKFEFFSAEKELHIQPAVGELSFGKQVKIYFILKPKIDNEEIIGVAKEIKEGREIDNNESRSRDIFYAQGSTATLEGLKSVKSSKSDISLKSKLSSASGTDESSYIETSYTTIKEQAINNNQSLQFQTYGQSTFENTSQEHLIRAKLKVLKNKQSVPFYTRVKCFIETKTKSRPSMDYNNEMLMCDVISNITRPDIVIITSDLSSEISFPPTAVGTRCRWPIEVHNTSGKTVFVTRSILGTEEIFTCPLSSPNPIDYYGRDGILLKPEQHLMLYIIFSPLDEELRTEYFEFKANQTVITLKVRGKGVVPHFSISPEFAVCKLEGKVGKKIGLNVNILNKCDAELSFHVLNCFKMVAYKSEIFKVDKKKKTHKKSVITESCAERNVVDDLILNYASTDQPIPIQIEPEVLTVPSNQNSEFKIIFYIPKPKKPIKKKGKKKSKIGKGVSNKKQHGKNIPKPESRLSNIIDSEGEAEVESMESIESSLFIHETEAASEITVQTSVTEKLKPTVAPEIVDTTPSYYALKVCIALGRLVSVTEWFIIATTKGSSKKGRKKKNK